MFTFKYCMIALSLQNHYVLYKRNLIGKIKNICIGAILMCNQSNIM